MAHFKGVVKQVLSGDSVVIRGKATGGPPPERTVSLAHVVAPRLGRKDSPDEPFAWDSREFLRQLLIGKEIAFKIEYSSQSGREYASLYLAPGDEGNVTPSLISGGWVRVVEQKGEKGDKVDLSDWRALEQAAQAKGVGIWSKATPPSRIRDVKWSLDNPRALQDKAKGKPLKAIVERVRDGASLQVLVIPTFQYATVLISGIKCPIYRKDVPDQPDLIEPFAAEAKFFTESRLLNQEIEMQIEGINNKSLVASIRFHRGNIAEALLREGLAKVADWSITMVTGGPKALREAEAVAKKQRLRLFHDYVEQDKDKHSGTQLTGKVVKIISADTIIISLDDVTKKTPEEKKISLSSIRQPRLSDRKEVKDPKDAKDGKDAKEAKEAKETKETKETKEPKETKEAKETKETKEAKDAKDGKESYIQLQAREHLRKMLIGKKVSVSVDYLKPAEGSFEEKLCATVKLGDKNVAEDLVAQGLAVVIKHKHDDPNRSPVYDLLRVAEEKAEKEKKGIHSANLPNALPIDDLSENVSKAKQYFPRLNRLGKVSAVVEHVFNGSRLKIWAPKERFRATLILSGVACGRVAKDASEPFALEAFQYVTAHTLQHDVEVEIESQEKNGAYVGSLFLKNGENLTTQLLDLGYGFLHGPSADQSPYVNSYYAAEARAKAAKKNIWAQFLLDQAARKAEKEAPLELTVQRHDVAVLEVFDDARFYVQMVGQASQQLEDLMKAFSLAHASLPPPSPSTEPFVPRVGALCSARFSLDNQWYRARIQAIRPSGSLEVFYIDYGNSEELPPSKLRLLPSEFATLPPQATLCNLACLKFPSDEDFKAEAKDAFAQMAQGRKLTLSVLSKGDKGLVGVLFEKASSGDDYAQSINAEIVASGLALVEKRREKPFAPLLDALLKAQDDAKAQRLMLWRHGDVTDDDDDPRGRR